MPDLKKIDKNFDNKESVKELKYYNPKDCDNLSIFGLNWFKEDKRYVRFPAYSDEMITKLAEGLIYLVKQPSGAMLAFRSNTKTLKLKVKGLHTFMMSHMAFTGQGGFDLYIGRDLSSLMFFKTASYSITKTDYEFTFFENVHKDENNDLFLINFPLYASVEDIELGFDPEAYVTPVNDLFKNGKIVVYGTSVTQGGCASRPGISYTNQLSRRMGYEFLNFGFSGNGRGQKEVVDLLVSIDDVQMYILDYEANATLPMLEATLDNFIVSIRKKYPYIPILVLSKVPMAIEMHDENAFKKQRKSLNFQKRTVKKYQAMGDENIYFYDGHKLFGKYAKEASVDGAHPTDLGFMMMSDYLEKELKKILKIK